MTRRLTPPGPRCATCHRQRKAETKQAAHARRINNTYGITAEEYQIILDYQGGVCAICQHAKGIRRKLAVDHDHATGLVRGALCNTCNRVVIGRYNRQSLTRAIEYLDNPPAFAAIGQRKVPTQERKP